MPAQIAVPKPVSALLHSIPKTAETLGVSRSKIYELIEAGEIAYLKIGSRTLVERSEIERFIAAHRVVGGA